MRNWKQFFKPVRVSERLGVRPPWEPRPDWGPSIADLVIEPGLAFGTGTHATTQLCLAWLDDLIEHDPPTQVLDVGCGSGILSIAVAKLSPHTAIRCLDVDPEARRITAENTSENGVSDRVEVLSGILTRATEPADLVVANILAHILLQLRESLVGVVAPGGGLLLSGIGVEDEAELTHAFTSELTLSERREQDGWVALLFRHEMQ